MISNTFSFSLKQMFFDDDLRDDDHVYNNGKVEITNYGFSSLFEIHYLSDLGK